MGDFKLNNKGSSNRDRKNKRNFKDKRSSRRDNKKPEFTKVICDSCNQECEVPFKPTSSKPIYCRDCFEKPNKGNNNSNKDFDIINKKLDKIMKALKI